MTSAANAVAVGSLGMFRARGSLFRWATMFVLFSLTIVVVLANQQRQGIARDETVYMTYGSKYATWWSKAVSGGEVWDRQSITGYFGGIGRTDNNREHPPLMKTLFWSVS